MELTFGTWRIAIEQIRPSQTELAHTYNQAAAQWESSIKRLGYVRAYADLFKQIETAHQLQHLNESSRVLDAGIGTGALSSALMHNISTQVELHGIDISESMLSIAHRNLRSTFDQLVLSQQDVTALEYPENSFDMVMAAHTLEHLDDPLSGLKALVHVLKPGSPLLLVISRRHFLSAWLKLKWAISRTTPSDLEACFSAAGLTDIKLIPLASKPWVKHMSLACIGVKR